MTEKNHGRTRPGFSRLKHSKAFSFSFQRCPNAAVGWVEGSFVVSSLGKENAWAVAKKPENEKFDGFQKVQTLVSKTCLIQNSKRMRKKQEIENRLLFSGIQIPSRIPINSKILVFICVFANFSHPLKVSQKL
ncbi:MAG: hypothetical protein IJU61_00355 [Victivallales bacterium]|nr:hypothetical protein [Victivallales bacterium]